VVLDDLEQDRAYFGSLTHQREQQPVAVIQFSPIELAVIRADELLDVRRTEIVPLQRRNDAAKGGVHARDIKA